MRKIQLPPRIYRPTPYEDLSEAILKVSESMETLAAWMYETAKMIEQDRETSQ